MDDANRRRRFRFSLRTLLIVVFAAACVCYLFSRPTILANRFARAMACAIMSKWKTSSRREFRLIVGMCQNSCDETMPRSQSNELSFADFLRLRRRIYVTTTVGTEPVQWTIINIYAHLSHLEVNDVHTFEVYSGDDSFPAAAELNRSLGLSLSALPSHSPLDRPANDDLYLRSAMDVPRLRVDLGACWHSLLR